MYLILSLVFLLTSISSALYELGDVNTSFILLGVGVVFSIKADLEEMIDDDL
jgi:hypothetical protein